MSSEHFIRVNIRRRVFVHCAVCTVDGNPIALHHRLFSKISRQIMASKHTKKQIQYRTTDFEKICDFTIITIFCRYYWNDRRSRCMFLCFYSAIFQLTSAKFQTFAYNSRTAGSSNMKFGQQFEINALYVCTKFRGNMSRGFGFRTRKPPRKFGLKSGLSQKLFKHGKKYFIGLYVSRYPFIPTNPLLAAMRFFLFFFPFFSS